MHLEITWNAYLQIKWELNKVAWRIFFYKESLKPREGDAYLGGEFKYAHTNLAPDEAIENQG